MPKPAQQENIAELKRQLAEARQELHAISSGEVDAVVIQGKNGGVVFSQHNTTISNVIESITDAFFALDKHMHFIYVNSQAEVLFGGKKKEELMGRSIWSIFPYLKKSDAQKNFGHCLASGDKMDFEEYYPKLGKWVELHVYPSRDGISVFARDITVQKHIQEELAQSKEQLNVILQGVADGITVQDHTGAIVFVNDAAARMSGYNSPLEMYKAWKSKHVKKYHVADSSGNPFSLQQMPGRRVLNGEKNPEAIVRYVNISTEQVMYSLIKSTPIVDTRGKVIYAINIFRDITEQIEQDKRKDEFLSIASHELKTPMTSLKAYTQILQQKIKHEGDSASELILGRMDGQINKLATLVQDLLDVSKIQAGKLEFQKKPFDVEACVSEIVEDFQPTLLKKFLVIKTVSVR